MLLLADFRDADGADLDVLEQIRVLDLLHLRVLPARPDWRRAAVGVADAEVVEIDFVSAGLGSFENDRGSASEFSSLGCRSRGHRNRGRRRG